MATWLQSAEIDRRPQQPRQLAGEYGSSADGEACFDAAELSGACFFDADAKAVRCCKSLDDPVNADRPAADAAFKPKCLGIASSIRYARPTPRRSRLRFEHVVAIQSKRFA
ncbi:hypothetical protein QA635_18130 [Bradyrhizobium brasilense]|uniref:hypothetical protein n=1 Tax=Bradyrhizobium brasilense TaxID=1419277 RepID=UPI0024B183D1|nr:hypothetical protein [Bradyrhizobium australafricanum]WFU36220.1 hypothetical protein QA635_18130 [Bradyrhizobium australafricanum]